MRIALRSPRCGDGSAFHPDEHGACMPRTLRKQVTRGPSLTRRFSVDARVRRRDGWVASHISTSLLLQHDQRFVCPSPIRRGLSLGPTPDLIAATDRAVSRDGRRTLTFLLLPGARWIPESLGSSLVVEKQRGQGLVLFRRTSSSLEGV